MSATNGHTNGVHTRNGISKPSTRMPFAAEIVMVLISMLKPARYNHDDRSDPKSKEQIIKLANSLVTTMTCMPIYITPGHDIIEGHRRTAALKYKGFEHAPCIVYHGNPDILYALINDNQKALDSHKKLCNYLASSDCVTSYMQAAFVTMERIVGRDAMQKLADMGGSHATFKQALIVADRCGRRDDTKFITKAMIWLKKRKMTKAVRQYLDANKPAIHLYNAVAENRPLWCCECDEDE